MVHLSSDECPFDAMHLQPPIAASCCTLFAEFARKNLIALQQDGLAEDMEDDLSCLHAVQLGLRLLAWADVAEEVHGRNGSLPYGRAVAYTSDDDTPIRSIAHATFEQAIASVRVAAHWYEEIGRRGYGVKTQWR